MIVAGIDSAAYTGIVILKGTRILRRGTCRVTGAVDVERAVAEIAEFRPDLVAVEAPFVRVNPQTGLALAELLGRWLQALERRWIETMVVLASTWQPEILQGRITSRSNREARKAAARAWALETFGRELPGDQADAAGIATWAARRAAGIVGRSKATRIAPAPALAHSVADPGRSGEVIR